jgi:hypothetical protein
VRAIIEAIKLKGTLFEFADWYLIAWSLASYVEQRQLYRAIFDIQTPKIGQRSRKGSLYDNAPIDQRSRKGSDAEVQIVVPNYPNRSNGSYMFLWKTNINSRAVCNNIKTKNRFDI